MQIVGPIVTREGGYAFDCWTPGEGLSRGYPYRRIGDARYARNIEIRSHDGRTAGRVVCSTLDEFASALAERQLMPFGANAYGSPAEMSR